MSGRSTVFTFIGKDEFSKVAGNVEKSASGMSSKMGKAGLAVAGGLAMAGTAAIAAGAAFASMAKGAMEDQSSQVKLAKTLENTTGATKAQVAAVEAYISKTGEATGIADDKMRPALARLAASTKDVGKAQEFATLAQDISAGTGKDYVVVANALAKANDGQMGALKKLGISLGANAENAASYNAENNKMVKLQAAASMALDGYGPKSKEYAAAQAKVAESQGKLNALQKEGIDWTGELAETFQGQAAASADTLEGKLGRLRIMFDETKESIGAKLLPVLSDMGTWFLEKGVPAIRAMAEKVLPVLKGAWDNIKQTIEENRPGLEKLGVIFGVVAGFVVTKVMPALVTFNTFILQNLIRTIAKIGDVVVDMAPTVLDGLATVIGYFRTFYSGVTGILEGILKVASATMGWIPGIGDKITAAKEKFSTFRDGTVDALGKVEASLRGASEKVTDFNNKELKDKNATVTVTANIKWSAAAERIMAKPGFEWGDGRAGGGLIRGPGTGTSDSIPAMLSDGEYVLRSSAVSRIGVAALDALNGGATSIGATAPTSGGTGNVYVTINGGLDSAETIARTVQRALLDLKRRQGVSLGLA